MKKFLINFLSVAMFPTGLLLMTNAFKSSAKAYDHVKEYESLAGPIIEKVNQQQWKSSEERKPIKIDADTNLKLSFASLFSASNSVDTTSETWKFYSGAVLLLVGFWLCLFLEKKKYTESQDSQSK